MSATNDPPTAGDRPAASARPASRRRLLVVVNPNATTVSTAVRDRVLDALSEAYEVEARETARRNHATEISREAAAAGYDAVVALGGDGTINEVANGLVGSSTPLSCLPGGRANVYCRMLGLGADVAVATNRLLTLAERWSTRTVDLGRVGERHFLFSAGVGLDASVVAHVDAHPHLKARLGHYYYAWVAAATYAGRYLVRPPRLSAQPADGEPAVTGVTALVQNGAQYTYFGDREVRMVDGASLNSGDLAALVLGRASLLDMPTITLRALSHRVRVGDHRHVSELRAQARIRVRSLDRRELPLQVDGDYIGRGAEHQFSVVPGALHLLV